jgi:hypothetical protein
MDSDRKDGWTFGDWENPLHCHANQVGLHTTEPNRWDPASLQHEPAGQADGNSRPELGKDQVGVFGTLTGPADGGRTDLFIYLRKVGGFEAGLDSPPVHHLRSFCHAEAQRDREGGEELGLVGVLGREAVPLRP